MSSLRDVTAACAVAALATVFMTSALPSFAQSAQPKFEVGNLLPASITDFGTKLASAGVYLSAAFIQDLMSNVAGGDMRATYFPGELAIGATFDLQKMFGLPGSSLHIIFDKRSNFGINDAVGTSFLIGGAPGGQQIHLSELYWEQGFDHDRLDLIFGRTNPTLFFATSSLACVFAGEQVCAQPNIWYDGIIANLPFPFSEWGGRANFQITKDIYIRAGAFQDYELPNQGFSWQWDRSRGVFVPFEVGYQTATGYYYVGGYHDGGTHTWAWYANAQQAVWASGPRILTALAGGLTVTNGPAPYWGQYYLGALLTAPLLSRPHDTFGVEMSLLTNSHFTVTRFQSGIYNKSYAVEADYGISAMPGVFVMPFVEYFMHPNATPHRVDNAWILGGQLFIDLGAILKWPVFVPH